MSYEVIVLKEGYSIKEGPGQQKACGTITLVKGPHNIIVDTGNPWDKDLIIDGLRLQGVEPHDISYVVCTSGNSDKVGNLNIFANAMAIIAREISRGDHYLMHGFGELTQWRSALNFLFKEAVLGDVTRSSVRSFHSGLNQHDVPPDKIEYAVCTHGHSDHVGNLNLFTKAIHIVSNDICVGDAYLFHEFKQGIPYEIDDNVEVISTPGHTGSDVSVVVRNTAQGTVVVSGDLFECLEDLEDYTIWQENSENPEIQQQNRMDVLSLADWIVPGHGPMFQVPEEYKKQLKMVMYQYEQITVEGPSGSNTQSEYLVVEDN